MKTTRILSLAVAATLAASLPAGAGPRGPKPLAYDTCVDQVVSVNVPRAQAQAYLPEGFTVSNGSFDRPEAVHVNFNSIICGEGKLTLQMSRTSVAVEPPAELQGPTSSDFFVLDMGSTELAGARLRKQLCLGSVLEDAEIQTEQAYPSTIGPAAGVTTISSPSLNVAFSVTAGGDVSQSIARNRWYFENDAGEIDYFETIDAREYLGMGGGALSFTAPYRDMALANPQIGLLKTKDVTFYPSLDCAR